MRIQMSPVRWVSLVALGLLAVVSVFALSIFVWEDKCDEPSDEAQRVLIPVVKQIETQELAASGRVGDLDKRLRSGPQPHIIGLEYYRVLTRKTNAGFEVVIKPSGWCFCRPTYVLRQGGKQLEIVRPLLNRWN